MSILAEMTIKNTIHNQRRDYGDDDEKGEEEGSQTLKDHNKCLYQMIIPRQDYIKKNDYTKRRKAIPNGNTKPNDYRITIAKDDVKKVY